MTRERTRIRMARAVALDVEGLKGPEIARRLGMKPKGLESLAAAYELGDPVEAIVTTAMYPIFVRGQAYLSAGDGYKAATEFQRVLDHLGRCPNWCDLGAV